jgi:hypothetical protein
MSQFQQEYGYTPTNPAAQRQLQGLGEFLQQLETEYKIPHDGSYCGYTRLSIEELADTALARDLVREYRRPTYGCGYDGARVANMPRDYTCNG